MNKQFGAALAKRDLVRMLEVRAEFHAKVAHATRNRWLAEILIMLRDRAYVVRHLHWQDFDRAAQTLKIHDAMIDAMQHRDAKGYRELVVRQIKAAIEVYDSQLRAPASVRPRRAPATESRRTRAVAK